MPWNPNELVEPVRHADEVPVADGGETPRPIATFDGGLPTHGRLREDRGSHTEADAGRFEAAHAYRPSRLEDAMDRGYEPEPGDYR